MKSGIFCRMNDIKTGKSNQTKIQNLEFLCSIVEFLDVLIKRHSSYAELR